MKKITTIMIIMFGLVGLVFTYYKTKDLTKYYEPEVGLFGIICPLILKFFCIYVPPLLKDNFVNLIL